MARTRQLQPQLLAFLALALLLRALVPAGFMPGHGTLLELCTLEGMRTVLVDPQTGELLDDDPPADSPDCPWAAVFVAAVLPQWPQALTSPFAEAPARLVSFGPRFFHAYVRPPARAPPLS